MALLNPVYAIILPFLFMFTLPIALFATLTTFLSFSLLFLRVLAVYFELAIAVIPYYLLGLDPTVPSINNPYSLNRLSKTQKQPTSPVRRKRRTCSSSTLSAKSLSNSRLLTPTP
jgi:hypothetical protein